MGMVSMATKDEGIEPYEPSPYGYGLCIRLTEQQVEALGLEANPPAAGSTVAISALATVVRLTQEADPADEDQDIDVTLELQITDMEVVPGGGVASTQLSAALYEGG